MIAGARSVPALVALRHARAHHETTWRWLRLVGPLIIGLQIIVLSQSAPGPGRHGEGLVISVAIAAFAASAFGTFAARSGPTWVRWLSIAVLFVASVVLLRLQPSGPGVLGVFVAVALIGRKLPPIPGTAVVGAGLVLLLVGGDRSPLPALLTSIAMASFYAVMRLAERLSETNEEAERLLLELERTRDAQARAAALAERQRLAREMHDVLAHSLSALVLQLEGATVLAAGDDRLSGVIDRARHLAGSGLDEARHAIGMLRDDQALPGPGELPALTARFENDTGIRCELTVAGDEHALDADARLAVYRVAQESLTNIAKHATRQQCVTVKLNHEPGLARLSVEDYGDPATTSGCSGYGLTGMRERAELLGGRLDAGPTPTGFRVELEVPA
ncbi:two-component sensor histidine kinase [Kribbella pittospori]|uniref:histidine kinase n=1 Tax=Kribbella pittospori TaxID=722689 RepID=A0A4R0KVH8_9ACTN|nr:histidine kinase [Kribbella pittospori]TCC63256.1 two-component sensor histidine kinase [Kribbella pittospori]